MNKIIVFLPCRKGSQRVKNKNTRKFAGIEGGLTAIKLKELLKVPEINKIILSTNDEEVRAIGLSFNDSRIIIDNRPEHLASNEALTDDLIKYVPSIISDEHIMWTHVTSPFIKSETYSRAINEYFGSDEYDSMMSVTKIQTFLWNKERAFNYDRAIEKWPRTQTIEPLFEVNSAFFIAPRNIYLSENDRIGRKPSLFELDRLETIDIDWEDDFVLAEKVWLGSNESRIH